jgi:symplekin
LRRWDSFPYPVKICCIKFVQRVVQVQTHGLIADPRVCLHLHGCPFRLIAVRY